MNPVFESLFFALVAAIASVIGGFIVTSSKWAMRSLRGVIALGSGFMLGTVFLEMMPESMNLSASTPAWVLVGYGIVHIFEHTFASHLHFGEETHHDEMMDPVVGISALVGMLVHTFFDGVAIGAGFIVSPSVGILIFLAVLLHKIPDGFTISSILITSGYSNRTALWAATS
jgi:ZIP family zinc transporter/zinc and cadmium transporter